MKIMGSNNTSVNDFLWMAKQGLDFVNKHSSNDDTIRVDGVKDENKIVLLFDVPGVEKNDITINVEDDIVIIQYDKNSQNNDKFPYFIKERKWGHFKKSVKLPHPVDINNINASIKNGVLKLVFNRIESKRVKVNII